MKVSEFAESDLAQLYHLQPDGWNNISIAFRNYVDKEYCKPIKVQIDQQIVGIGCCILHQEIAWLGHIIVHKDYRNKGIGKQITLELMQIAQENKCKTIQHIATDLGAPVYKKVGFIETTEYIVFQRSRSQETFILSNFIIPFREGLQEQIYSLDNSVTAENRRSELEDALKKGFYYIEKETLKGFYLPELGEGLIIASEASAGLALLNIHIESNDKVILPKDNTAAIAHLLANGFEEKNRMRRMTWGTALPVQFEFLFNRIGGNIG